MIAAIYTLERGDVEFVDVSDMTRTEPCLLVNASVGACGHAFKGIAAIVEPEGQCPKLLIRTPLGVSAVKEIIEIFERRKAAALSGGKP